MRKARLWGLVATVLGLSLWGATPLFAQPVLVDDDKVDCPTAKFTTIQAAVDAASPGTTIKVCPGTYNEQVLIPKRLRIKGDNGAVVMPSAMKENTTNLFNNSPIAAAIVVTAPSGNVTISSLAVDGAANGIVGCSPVLVGIFYRNASGTVQDAAVRNMQVKEPACSSGIGILVQSGEKGSSRVTVRENSIHDFQKSGIVGNELGTVLTATRNVVTGSGPSKGAVQNGIQVGFGASGQVIGNTSLNHVSAACIDVLCETAATGLLILEAGGVQADFNAVGSSQVGIYVREGTANQTNNNNIFGADTFDGIIIVGDDNDALSNSITGSDRSGILVSGNKNKIRVNHINEAAIGVWDLDGKGNDIANNVIVNTLIPLASGNPSAPLATALSAASPLEIRNVEAFR
jgi:hypothetical protein